MKLTHLFLFIAATSAVAFYACKDKTEPQPEPAKDVCSSKSLSVKFSITAAVKCQPNGKVLVRAGGSTGFTYNINNGSFQADSNFAGLTAGHYTVTIKDKDGCTKSDTFSIWESGVKGPLFTSAYALIQTNRCMGTNCHGTGLGGAPKEALNTECRVLARKDLINSKVLGKENMGTLNASDKKKISDWINAGGRYTD